jgi:uncharacterized protein (DUF2267 family)
MMRMTHDEFIGHVADRAKLSSRGDALTATRATLETLAERIPQGEATDLAAQLPKEIGLFLKQDVDKTERFDSDEFIERVAKRANVDVPTATFQVRAVLDVVSDAASAGEVAHVKDALPENYQRLFAAGVEGDL